MTDEKLKELADLIKLFEMSDLVTLQVKGQKVGLGPDLVKDIVELARKGIDMQLLQS